MTAQQTQTHVWEKDFVCPICRSALGLSDASLICLACGSRYPVISGIPRFVGALDGTVAQTQAAFDFEHRRFEQSEHTVFGPHVIDQFLAHVALPASFFAGKRCLDAGCGSGRWTYALIELGAEVVAVDLTASGVEILKEHFGDRSNLVVAQADIFQLPFCDETFDFVMSWGVLHHTPSTRAAFDHLVPLVTQGGIAHVMVYDIDQGRGVMLTNLVRAVMRRLSPERRYDACRLLMIRHKRLFSLLNRHMIVVYADPATSPLSASTLQFGLYDAYSPTFNFLHSRAEVAEWFAASGFEEVTVIPSPQGAVEIRGRRSL